MSCTPKENAQDKSNPKAFRPIILISMVGKTYDRLVALRLVEYLESNSLLQDSQNGFRKGKNIVSALLNLNEAIDLSNKLWRCFLDIYGAFDGV